MPIPGTTRRARLDENLAALQVELDAATLDALDAAFPLHAAAGERYSVSGMANIES